MWDSVKIRKEILKVGGRRSRFLEYAECGHFALLFCKERQWNEQNYNPRLHSHCTRCRCGLLIKFRINGKITNSQRAQSKRRPSRTKRQLRVQKTFVSGSFRENRLGSPRIASNILGRTGHHVRGITLGVRPIERFHMTSRRPCWCSKTKEWRPWWCIKLILWDLNSICMQILSLFQ